MFSWLRKGVENDPKRGAKQGQKAEPLPALQAYYRTGEIVTCCEAAARLYRQAERVNFDDWNGSRECAEFGRLVGRIEVLAKSVPYETPERARRYEIR